MQLATFTRDFEFREMQGTCWDGWWVRRGMETIINWANFGEESVINFESKVIKKLGSWRVFVLEIPCFIKLGLVARLDDAQRQIKVLDILIGA
jgi:hypothetical protein